MWKKLIIEGKKGDIHPLSLRNVGPRVNLNLNNVPLWIKFEIY